MIYYDGTLINANDSDLDSELAIERATETLWKKKISELYYDCCEILDNDPIMKYAQWDMRSRINKFFKDNLNKTL